MEVLRGGYFFSLRNARSAYSDERAVSETWLDHADTSWLTKYSGSEDDPYQISSAEELAGLSQLTREGNNLANCHFKQIANIDLGGYEWLPIGVGNNIKEFSGFYDGNGFTISRMKIVNYDAECAALFGSVHEGVIKNITLKKSIINSSHNVVGSFVGLLSCSTLSNCHSDAKVYSSGFNIAGLVGWDWRSTIIDCSFSGVVEGMEQVGGIIGTMHGFGVDQGIYGVAVKNCFNFGYVKAERYVGGIAGVLNNEGNNKIENCISRGIVEGDNYTGSLVGFADTGSVINNCVSEDVLTFNGDSSSYVGELVGNANLVTIENSCFLGVSNIELSSFVDAKVTSATINNCYAYAGAGVGYFSDGNFSEFVICDGINDGLPIQKALYHIAQFGESIGASWFAAHGFSKV